MYTAADVSDYEINDNVTIYYFDFDILDRVIFESTIADSSAEYGIWTIYNSPDNIYTKEEVDAKVAAAKEETRAEIAPLKPKTVAFTKDENISDITIYNYCSDSAIASPEVYAEPVYARDGDFGFPCIDGTGQVNFSPIFLNDYNALAISGDVSNFKNFKTPYSTCKDKIYRLTKVIGDSTINLSAIDENALDSYAITYRLVIPADYAGALPAITEYRTNDAMIANYSPKTLEFVDNACVSKSYSKETGYPDKTESDAAQINFTAE